MNREKIGWALFLIGFLIACIFALSIPGIETIHPVNSYFAVLLTGELLLLFGFKKIWAGTLIDKLKIVIGIILLLFSGLKLIMAIDSLVFLWFFLGITLAGMGASLLGNAQSKQKAERKEKHFINPFERLKEIIKEIDKITLEQKGESANKKALENIKMNFLMPFAENRHHFALQYGVDLFAEFFSFFSTGERYINRAWSSLVDNAADESAHSLSKAKEYFERAYKALQEEYPRKNI